MADSWGGMDSRRSWIVAVACFFVQVLTFGLTEASGLLFVATIPRFGTTREKASLPFSIVYCLRSAVGPVVGLLGRRFGIRLVTLVGSILSALSVASCFFATNILEFILLWGVVFGFSLGLETSLLNVILNEHFDKHLVKANGLIISGASLGTLLLSPVIEHCVEAYGLSGTFLIISGLMLNSIPAVIIMMVNKPPKFHTRTNVCENKGDKLNISLIVDSSCFPSKSEANEFVVCHELLEENPVNNVNSERSSEKPAEKTKVELSRMQTLLQFKNCTSSHQNTSHFHPRFYNIKPAFMDHIFSHLSHSRKMSNVEISSIKLEQNIIFTEMHYENKTTENNNALSTSNNTIFLPVIPSTYIEPEHLRNEHISSSYIEPEHLRNEHISSYYIEPEHLRNELIPGVYTEPEHLPNVYSSSNTITNENIILNNSTQNLTNSKWQLHRLFTEPIYIIIITGSGVYYFIITTFLTIIVDYATDLGISITYSTYIVMWIAFCDIFGYMFQSWIIERCKNITNLKQCHFTSLSFLCLCLASVAMTWCSHFVVLLVLICVFEVAQCGVIILAAPLVAEYMDADLHATGIASLNILSSPMTLAISPLIGYFRDGQDSYDGVFYVISSCSLLCSLLFLCIPKLQSRRPKNLNGVTKLK